MTNLLRLIVLYSFLLTIPDPVISQQELMLAFKDSLQSDVLDEQRDLWIHLPSGYSEDSEYPVLYLLDGQSNLRSTLGVVSQLSGKRAPSMIIVAVNNTNRNRDMTPYGMEIPPGMEDNEQLPAMFRDAGGGKQFVDFLITELIPHVEAKYATAPYRILAGHSLTGLLALYASIFHNDEFDACIAVDPSIAWANGRLIKELKEGHTFTDDRIFIGIANTFMESTEELTEVEKNESNPHYGFITQLGDKLETYSGQGLAFKSQYYPDESHNSAPLITTYDGLRFIYKDYPAMNSLAKITMMVGKGATDEEIDIALTRIMENYESATKTYGFKIAPSQRMVNMIGYNLIEMNNVPTAEKFFLMNVHFYPESQNVYDSLGDCYVKMGKKEKAIAQFQKALEIEERPHTKEKLEKLLAE